MKIWIKNNRWLLVIIAVSAVLRFYKLDTQSLWIDEIFSLLQAHPDKSFKEIYLYLKEYDVHPPLYYFLLHVFVKIFGYSAVAARGLSVVLGVGGIGAIYLLGKEISDKKTGLIAAVLACFNFFHLYYSQEARMYSLLFLTTTFSFYYLIKFIKKPTYRTAIVHALFATAMLYTQFFALFALLAQYIILLVYVIRPYGSTRLEFFKKCLTSGLLTLLLFIPALLIFLQTSSQTQSFWINVPTADVYTNMFLEFFGHSEMVLFIVIPVIGFYFMRLFMEKDKTSVPDPVADKDLFGFLVLLTWIVVCLFFPLAYSFMKLPIIMSRYFIDILPVVVLLAAIGFSWIRSNFLRMTLLSLVVLFSLTDIFLVKDYYSKVTKTEWRELASAVNSKNARNAPIVTRWHWLMPYYFPNSKVIPGPLDNYVNGLRSGSGHEAFWYVDGHESPYSVTAENQAYLDANFKVRKKFAKFDSWAILYVPIHHKSIGAAP